MRLRVVILIFVFAVTGPLYAEDDALSVLRAQQTNRKASSPSTSETGSTPGNRDFLSQLIAALESYSASGGQKLTFDYNFPIDKFAGKLQVSLSEPALHEKLAKAQAANTATLKTLKDELDFGDDIAFTFSISPQAKTKVEKVERALMLADDDLLTMRTSAILLSRQTAAGLAQVSSASDAPPQFSALDAALRGEPLPTSEETRNVAADTDRFALTELRRFAAKDIIRDAAIVAANQSKWVFDAAYRQRSETVGQDEWSLKASYEYGPGTNVEKRQGEIASDCAEMAARLAAGETEFKRTRNGAECKNPMAGALDEAAKDDTVKTGTRLTFNLEYHDFSAVQFSRTDLTPSVEFDLPNSRSVVASLVGGRDVFLADPDPNDPAQRDRSGRIELTVTYDDVSGDENRKDKLIGTLTYSQRITDTLFIPVSLTYANHTDYLTNVDRKLNAHFGIAYKLPDMKK